jgi:hypothetical protein
LPIFIDSDYFAAFACLFAATPMMRDGLPYARLLRLPAAATLCCFSFLHAH